MGNRLSHFNFHHFTYTSVSPEINPVKEPNIRKHVKIVSTYYTNEQPDHIDYILANESWNLIINDDETIKSNICNKKNVNITCIHLFYESFYDKLSLVYPEANSIFKNGVHDQSKMLIHMISSVLELFYNPEVLKKLKDVISSHLKFGIRSFHFYLLGDVLLYSLDQVLMEYFNVKYYDAWRKIYSYFLKIVIPIIKKNEDDYQINDIVYNYTYHYSNKNNELINKKYSETSFHNETITKNKENSIRHELLRIMRNENVNTE